MRLRGIGVVLTGILGFVGVGLVMGAHAPRRGIQGIISMGMGQKEWSIAQRRLEPSSPKRVSSACQQTLHGVEVGETRSTESWNLRRAIKSYCKRCKLHTCIVYATLPLPVSCSVAISHAKMLPPPKRRKTSETTGVAVAQAIDPGNDTRPSDRPSFQSPTRASLARAHPEILERALSRSPSRRPTSRGSQNGRSERSEAKSFGLRDRKAFRPSLNASASPLNRPRMSGGAPVLSPNRRSSGIQAFSKPPRRISHKIVSSDFMLGSPVGKQIQPAEQSQSNTPEDQLALELGSATKDAGMDLGLDGAFMDDDPLEPELPPTPTQLGLEKAPDRPKGLLSSSPSLRHEKRIKRRTVDAFQGSPLKSSSFQSPSPEDSDDAELDSRQELSAAVLEKRKLRKSLAAELQQLKNDVAELETWSRRIDSEKDLTTHAKGIDRFL